MTTYLTSKIEVSGFDGFAIEGTGNITYVFPLVNINYNDPSRCYQDNIPGVNGRGESTTWVTTSIGMEKIAKEDDIIIYPGPCKDHRVVIPNEDIGYKMKIDSTLNQTVYYYISPVKFSHFLQNNYLLMYTFYKS